MRRVRILAEAAEEAIEAAAWYESQQRGLGTDFGRAIDAALDLLEDEVIPLTVMPGRGRHQPLKRLMLRRFPFDVVVLERDDEFVVICLRPPI